MTKRKMGVTTPNPDPTDSTRSPARPPHSRLAVASFLLALLGALVPIHLILLLLAIGTRVSHGYALASVIGSGACCAAGITLAGASLLDRRKNRVLGLAGWWTSIVACAFVAAAIRLAVRYNVLHQ